MNLVLFIAVLAVSFIVVRIGAVAFQLTGLEWSLAKFQSLSCFTGTGFTTREAELITGNPQRRRIASIIMVLGNAGFITMIATFANSLRPQIVADKLNLPLLPDFLPSALLPWINLVVIVATVYVMYRLFTNTKLVKKLTASLRRKILARNIVSTVSFEELLLISEGYGISRIQVCEDSPILDKTLSESGLRKFDITILAIVRKGKTIPNPSANTKMLLGDELVSFGRLENIREKTCAA
jgi:K+/H+ antiporter YhaU regulatory subunit KhtT